MSPSSPHLVLVAVNARYSHCSYAIRTLQANLDNETRSVLLECDLEITPLQLADKIHAIHPQCVGFSLYLWNRELILQTAAILRIISPTCKLIAGGPEVTESFPESALFDSLIIGEGESTVRSLLQNIRSGHPLPPRVIAPPENLETLHLPYHLYSDSDLQQRTVYVETSRGCPFGCAYCTSAHTGLRLFPLGTLLPALDQLWQRGLRKFKFLDRSFNAAPEHAIALLSFFLNRITPDTVLHFEIQPDLLPAKLLTLLKQFPPKTLHLEVGIQTLNPSVAKRIGRNPKIDKTLANLQTLFTETGATVHADLIFGLPGESLESFIAGFNRIVAQCDPPELQVNRLKGLPGTRIIEDPSLTFSPSSPYPILKTDRLTFDAIQQIERFARVWELIHNRGRFPHTVRLIHTTARREELYQHYQTIADKMEAQYGRLYAIRFSTLAEQLKKTLLDLPSFQKEAVEKAILADLNKKPM